MSAVVTISNTTEPNSNRNRRSTRSHGDGFVTPQFARVFGDNTDTVYGCHQWQSTATILESEIAGATADRS